MTNEEAKKMLKAKLECFKNETSGINHDCNMRLCDGCSLNYEQGNMGEQKEALDMAIKALEQTELNSSYNGVKSELEPYEDAISRQATKEMLMEEWTKYMPMELDINLSFVLDKISALPSVTPTRPHGEWIHFTDDFKDYVACSCCGYGEEGEVLLEDKTPFCPVCGADMREGETDAG